MSHDPQDGRHVIPQAEEKFTQEQLQIMKTQDLKYVRMKLNMETKVSGKCVVLWCVFEVMWPSQQKIERLQANLHLLNDDDGPPPNTHTIFVDSAEEGAYALQLLSMVCPCVILQLEFVFSVASFDPVKHFDTAPEFVTRTFNRPTRDILESQEIAANKTTAKVTPHPHTHTHHTHTPQEVDLCNNYCK